MDPCGHVQAYATNNAGDWMEYAFFNQHHYVRNLVVGNEDFELMVSWQMRNHIVLSRLWSCAADPIEGTWSVGDDEVHMLCTHANLTDPCSGAVCTSRLGPSKASSSLHPLTTLPPSMHEHGGQVVKACLEWPCTGVHTFPTGALLGAWPVLPCPQPLLQPLLAHTIARKLNTSCRLSMSSWLWTHSGLTAHFTPSMHWSCQQPADAELDGLRHMHSTRRRGEAPARHHYSLLTMQARQVCRQISYLRCMCTCKLLGLDACLQRQSGPLHLRS